MLTIGLLSMLSMYAMAQTHFTKTGKIIFKSNSVVEKIEATNTAVASILNTANGDVKVALNIKSFVFDKQLMQEHFNENYMESDKYPKSSFEGKITDLSAINFSKNGIYKTTVKGNMNMHGVTKAMTIPVTIQVNDNGISVNTSFKVAPNDFNINIPSIVKDKISKEIEVSFAGQLIEKK